MRPLSARELLTVWEQGLVEAGTQRALLLLAAASPEVSPDALARLSVGQRDSRLLTLRAWAFGDQLLGLVACPMCHEQLELAFAVEDARMATAEDMPPECDLEVDGYGVRFRLPNSLDLIASAQNGEITAVVRQRLLQHCLIAATCQGEAQTLTQLPSSVIEAMVERMATLDPQADVQTALECPACGHQWQAAFDIATFFWAEIEAWGTRILREVHELATAYNWSEADILGLSARRRQLYLNMVRQ